MVIRHEVRLLRAEVAALALLPEDSERLLVALTIIERRAVRLCTGTLLRQRSH